MELLEAKNEHHCEVFEKNLKKIKFKPITKSDADAFDDFTKFLLNSYFRGTNINLKLGSHCVRSKNGLHSIIFKTDDDYIKYLDVFPSLEQFMFISDEHHHESIHPDQALVYLLSKVNPNANYSCLIDDKKGSVISVECSDGTKLTIVDGRIRQ